MGLKENKPFGLLGICTPSITQQQPQTSPQLIILNMLHFIENIHSQSTCIKVDSVTNFILNVIKVIILTISEWK